MKSDALKVAYHRRNQSHTKLDSHSLSLVFTSVMKIVQNPPVSNQLKSKSFSYCFTFFKQWVWNQPNTQLLFFCGCFKHLSASFIVWTMELYSRWKRNHFLMHCRVIWEKRLLDSEIFFTSNLGRTMPASIRRHWKDLVALFRQSSTDVLIGGSDGQRVEKRFWSFVNSH